MAKSKSLSKLRSASRLCKLGAGIIIALGLGATVLYMSTFVQALASLRQEQGSSYAYISYTGNISALFLLVVPTLFFAIVLYVLGILMDFLGAETKLTPKHEERDAANEDELNEEKELEIVSLPADMR